MRKMLLTLALVAAPVLAVAQTPAQQSAQTPAAHDTTKAKAKPKAHRPAPKKPTAHDTTKAAAPAPRDSTKKPN